MEAIKSIIIISFLGMMITCGCVMCTHKAEVRNKITEIRDDFTPTDSVEVITEKIISFVSNDDTCSFVYGNDTIKCDWEMVVRIQIAKENEYKTPGIFLVKNKYGIKAVKTRF